MRHCAFLCKHSANISVIDDYVDLAIWTALETNLGIVCACLPAMRPLLRLRAHSPPQELKATRSPRKSLRSSIRSQWPGILYLSKAKPARFSRPRRTAASSFGYNQEIPTYSKSAICSVYKLRSEECRSPPWRSDEKDGETLRPPLLRRARTTPTPSFRSDRPAPTYSEEDIWDRYDDRIAEDRGSEQLSEGTGSDGWYGGSNRQGWIYDNGMLPNSSITSRFEGCIQAHCVSGLRSTKIKVELEMASS